MTENEKYLEFANTVVETGDTIYAIGSSQGLTDTFSYGVVSNPTRIISDENGYVTAVECIKMELGEPDASGRRSPKELAGSEFILPVDCVIMSLGTSPNPLLKQTTPALETKRRGEIVVDERGKTSIDGVYAGGDAVTGAATVISAMGAGKVDAKAIMEKLLK